MGETTGLGLPDGAKVKPGIDECPGVIVDEVDARTGGAFVPFEGASRPITTERQIYGNVAHWRRTSFYLTSHCGQFGKNAAGTPYEEKGVSRDMRSASVDGHIEILTHIPEQMMAHLARAVLNSNCFHPSNIRFQDTRILLSRNPFN